MPEGEQPPVKMVNVRRHDVTVTMNDLLTPLSKTAVRLKQANIGSAGRPEVSQELDRFTELVIALQSVARNLDQMDPTLLESKPTPPLDA